MKKLSKVFLSLALVLMVCLPMLTMTGCDLFGKKEPQLSEISISGTIKTEYYVGDAINLQSAKLLLLYEDDTEKVITLTNNMIEGFNTQTTGNKTMTITYKEKQTTVDYVVKANSIVSIELTKNIKSTYYLGEELDFDGAKLLVKYEDGTEERITLTNAMVSYFSTLTSSTGTLKITYEDKEVSVDYIVRYNVVDCKWCASAMYNGVQLGELEPDNFSSGYIYFVFNSNGKGNAYSYNFETKKFESSGEFDYNFKSNSSNEIEIKNIGGLEGNNATMEMLSDTQIKFYIDGGYFILTKDYYNL